MSQSGKVAVITGGADGLGKAFAKQLLDKGAKVAILDINETAGKETTSQFKSQFDDDRVEFFKCDVTNKEQVKEKFLSAKSHFSGLDIVINNAGIADETGNWEKSVHINVFGVMYGTFTAMELMGKDSGGNGGVIVNIGSFASLAPFAAAPVYGGTKGAVLLFSLALAVNPDVHEKKGIRINVLCPAFVNTRLVTGPLDGLDEKAKANFQAGVDRNGGMMEPSYVAESMMELIEDTGKNGQILKLCKVFGKAYHTLAPPFPY